MPTPPGTPRNNPNNTNKHLQIMAGSLHPLCGEDCLPHAKLQSHRTFQPYDRKAPQEHLSWLPQRNPEPEVLLVSSVFWQLYSVCLMVCIQCFCLLSTNVLRFSTCFLRVGSLTLCLVFVFVQVCVCVSVLPFIIQVCVLRLSSNVCFSVLVDCFVCLMFYFMLLQGVLFSKCFFCLRAF